MADEGGEKTEEPSEKKIQDARKQGNVPKSKDLTGVFVFLVGLGVVKASWPNFEMKIRELFSYTIDHMSNPVDLERATMNAMLMGLVDIPLPKKSIIRQQRQKERPGCTDYPENLFVEICVITLIRVHRHETKQRQKHHRSKQDEIKRLKKDADAVHEATAYNIHSILKAPTE